MTKSLDQVDIVLNPDASHFAHILGWISKTEGWMFNVDDYTTWLETFKKYWLYVAIDKGTHEAVACLSMSFEHSASKKEDEDIYCLGLYYVCPEWRNSGIGSVLFDKMMAIGGHAHMPLHGDIRKTLLRRHVCHLRLNLTQMLKMSPRYATKYCFDKMPNYKHNFVSIPTEHIVVPELVSEYTIKEADVVAYDVGISHRSRAKYLHRFLNTGKCYTKVALNSAGKVVGLCCIRVVYPNDLCIGPFYADNKIVAESLLSAVLCSIPNIIKHKTLGSLYPAVNDEARSLFESIGGEHTKIQPFTQCAFLRKIFPTADDKVFGVMDCGSSIV
ncbi:hypothetical protein Aduo_017518 [Ancylostoma duodenale]